MPRSHPKFVLRLLERALADLPPLPEALAKVLAESRRNDVSAHSLEAIISTDQALSSKVLRVVNSAYYGLPGQVQSLGQACVILGVSQIRNLSLSMATMGSAHISAPGARDTHLRFWKHSFGAASAAQWLARKKNLGLAEEDLAFVGGLLHDIGRLFLFANFPEVYAEALAIAIKRELPIQTVEMELAGMDHAGIGARMARAWNLPDDVCNLIEFHESPFPEGMKPSLYAVHIGDCINEYVYEDDPRYVLPPCHQEAYDWFGGSEAEWAELMSVTTEKVDAASQSYEAAA
ncbi:MAG TPA: HDOD domain-containing protein [Fimbriimonadaceae bacterium]|nr:HDOD domain-containing protein [Fimbriimonadaceae bacterium]